MLEKEIVIHEVTVNDIDGIIKVLKSTKLDDDAWNENERFVRENILNYGRQNQFIALVAELNSSIVGFVVCAVYPSFWECQKQGFIIDLFVSQPSQSKGIGSELLKAVIERATSEKIIELHVSTELKNTKAQKLYRELGFRNEHLLLELFQTK